MYSTGLYRSCQKKLYLLQVYSYSFTAQSMLLQFYSPVDAVTVLQTNQCCYSFTAQSMLLQFYSQVNAVTVLQTNQCGYSFTAQSMRLQFYSPVNPVTVLQPSQCGYSFTAQSTLLQFYSPVNAVKVMSSQSVNLPPFFPGHAQSSKYSDKPEQTVQTQIRAAECGIPSGSTLSAIYPAVKWTC